jgi:hypothetical protein
MDDLPNGPDVARRHKQHSHDYQAEPVFPPASLLEKQGAAPDEESERCNQPYEVYQKKYKGTDIRTLAWS